MHRAPEIDVTLPVGQRGPIEGGPLDGLEWFGGDMCWVQMMGCGSLAGPPRRRIAV